MTNIPLRCCYPACVAGKPRDSMHRRGEERSSKRITRARCHFRVVSPDLQEKNKLAVSVARGRRTQMLFGHVMPRTVLAHVHAAPELARGVLELGVRVKR